MKSSLYTLRYAAILGFVCALLLTFAASFTKPYRQANAEAEKILNILAALNVPLEPHISSKRLIEMFETNIRVESQNGQTVYLYSPSQDKDAVEAIAIGFSGRGLWGRIKGVLALESDRKTIRGVTFYEQEETPGLGGEIASSQFRNQFAGKSITGGIIIRNGGSSLPNGVDAITGATMTCDKVQTMLNAVIESIRESN